MRRLGACREQSNFHTPDRHKRTREQPMKTVQLEPLPLRSSRLAANRMQFMVLLALLGLSLALWWRPLVDDFRLALSSDAYTYILLILPLSIALILFEYREVFAGLNSRKWLGAILVSAALILRACTAFHWVHFSPSGNLSLNIGALVFWWIGSVVLCFGFEVFAAHLFPLCFLFLIVPLPERALAEATSALQRQSAWAASALFGATGVPVTHDGVVLSIPGLTIEVAHECSSIRSSSLLIVITLILAHLFLRSGWRKTLLVLAAFPLSVAKNGIRIFTIAELGTRVNPSFLHGSLHRHGGIVFLSLAVLMILCLLWILRRTEAQPFLSASMRSD
jgi:exosortase